MRCICFLLFALTCTQQVFSQSNLSLSGRISASVEQEGAPASLAIDGDRTTYWRSSAGNEEKWLNVVLRQATKIRKIIVWLEGADGQAVPAYAIQTYINGRWENRAEQTKNQENQVKIEFPEPILNDRLRVNLFTDQSVSVREIEIYGDQYRAEDATPVKKVLVNQSGYNLGKTKRFTAPHAADGTPFSIQKYANGQTVFRGVVAGGIGDFSTFDPLAGDEFVATVNGSTSHPFRIGPYWLERVTYQNMIDFMRGARHYVGTTDEIRSFSWAWRDGDFFNWALQSLVAQYLSNPEAYRRLDRKIKYVDNAQLSAPYRGKWGTLEPYDETAPDLVKLIHWDADVKITQGLEHEHQKAELAHFLYAFPYLKKWLPQQNFDVVYDYLKDKWTKTTVADQSTTRYDKSPEHNLLALKTKLGTMKGELPPGHSVIPNLMMYEVAKSRGEADAEKYFEAAYDQMSWMIAHLDWEDPLTTKGQRMSEHLTMRSFAYFYHEYPDRRPEGLTEKVVEWARVAIRRSHNMWDFRKYTDEGDWVMAGWNETGNVLGFPAAAIAAKSVLQDPELQKELDRLTWSHFDNAFGRNPTGRHFSYDGPKEIEGVDQGWYSTHHGGIGLLEPVRFVFDGSPKTNHYPNHPEIGNFGWTEGWVQFNTAFNTSMAYLANSETDIALIRSGKGKLTVRLRAPLNFDENQTDKIALDLVLPKGKTVKITLTEEGNYSKYLSETIRLRKRTIKYGGQKIKLAKGDVLSVSYGLGYFEKSASTVIE